jgi:hypothetical protein
VVGIDLYWHNITILSSKTAAKLRPLSGPFETSISLISTGRLPVLGEPCHPGRYKEPPPDSHATSIPRFKKVWGLPGGVIEKTPNILDEPDDSTLIHALQDFAEDDLASGTSSASGCLVVFGEVGEYVRK